MRDDRTQAIIEYIEARLEELLERQNNPGSSRHLDLARARSDAANLIDAAFLDDDVSRR